MVPRVLLALALAAVILPVGLAARAAAIEEPVAWKDCGGDFQCGTLAVPLDYSDPGGSSISLALIRRPASDAGHRIGSLLVNPGGPGASGVDFVRAWAGGVSSDIRDRFDIVGFDPRGVGQSSPIVCHENLQQFVAADPTPDSQAEWDAFEQQTRVFAQECGDRYGSLLQHLGTKDVARDMDRIRAALGDARLTYLGYSYGTVIGQVYADMFPGNVRAMVLDGAVDLALSTDERALTQARGFERALQDFLADCRKTECDLVRDGDPEKAVDELFAKAEAAPIPARGVDRPAGPGETLYGVVTPLYSHQAWPSLERAVTAGLEGNGAPLVRLTDSYLERQPDGSYANVTEANIAVNCLDQGPSSFPTTFAAYEQARPRFLEASKHFGAAFATALTCAYWQVQPDPLSPPKAEGTPPLLVVDTTGDPATPYEWGVAVSKQLPSARLLTFNGEGHTAYGRDGCINEYVDAYLLALELPPAGAQCGDPAVRQGTPPTEGGAASSSEGNATAVAGSPGSRSVDDGGSDTGLYVGIAAVVILCGLALGASAMVRWRRSSGL